MTVDRSRNERNVAATLVAAEIISMPRARAATAKHLNEYLETCIDIVEEASRAMVTMACMAVSVARYGAL